MKIICSEFVGSVAAGVVSTLVFVVLTGIINWVKWWCNARKFAGIWEYRDVVAETGEIKDLNDGHKRTIRIRRCCLNPRVLKASSNTYENNTPRSWEGRYEFITPNFVTGRYEYTHDEFLPQWGCHEFRTQFSNTRKLLLVTVLDGGMRGFSRSAQCFEKIEK